MTVGERLKAARLDAGMTQSRLCGKRITRNMLSMIENGSAKPSLSLLEYLASQLNLPVAYFLSDENGMDGIRRNSLMGNIRDRFRNGKWNGCIELCSSLDCENDDELAMIMAYCMQYSGEEYLHDGRISAAGDSFSSAMRYLSLTCYPCESVRSSAPAFLRFIKSLSFDAENVPVWNASFTEEERRNVFIAYIALLDNPRDPGSDIFAGNECFGQHISALLALKRGEGEKAEYMLKRALDVNSDTLARMCILRDLESIYRSRLDYENAFICADERKRIIVR